MKHGILLLFLFVTLGYTQSAYAVDTVVGTGTAESCTEANLKQQIDTVNNSSGGTITFDCGANPVTITLSSQLEISAPTTIDGGGMITLSGGNSVRVIQNSTGNTLTVRNISITDGFVDGNGAGIHGDFTGNLNIKNVTFHNNISNQSSFNSPGGGAVFIHEGTLIVEDSIFTNNGTNNGSGGAILVLLANARIERTRFEDNYSAFQGGGFFSDGTLNKSGFIELIDTDFIDNQASGQGGGAKTFLYSVDSKVTISDSNFIGNRVNIDGNTSLGGGLRHGNGPIEITNSTFANNLSQKQGGGIWIGDNGGFTSGKIENVTISSNRVEAVDPDQGYGGGITINENLPFAIDNVTIYGNYASNQGGGTWQGGDRVVIRNSIIAFNTSDNQWGIKQNCGQTWSGSKVLEDFNASGSNNPDCTSVPLIGNPLLGTLADNGGPTVTHSLLAGSAALDVGTCAVSKDQRGVSRPQGGGCDLGAFESDGEGTGGGNVTIPTNLSVDPNQGRPTLQWKADGDEDWYQIWIGIVNPLKTVHFAWYPAEFDNPLGDKNLSPIECDGLTCTLTPNINPTGGTYSFYMRSWSEAGGFSTGGTQGWAGPEDFSIPTTPPNAVTPLSPTINNGDVTFRWQGVQQATWYNIWVGTPGPAWDEQFFQWVLADNIGCENAETCELKEGSILADGSSYNLNLNDGEYVWYVRSWGPGGFSTGGLSEAPGWVAGDSFEIP